MLEAPPRKRARDLPYDLTVEVARFHVDSGPESVFERVRQAFAEPVQLQLHGRHFAERVEHVDAPLDALDPFDPAHWDLVLVEARTDTGKFVSTTWRRRFGTQDWWLVVGFNDTVRTFYRGDAGKRAKGRRVVTGGPVWQLVDKVNRQLVSDDPNPPRR
jgi:hypothetical protein